MADCGCSTVTAAFGQRLPVYWEQYDSYWKKVLSDAQITISVTVRIDTAGTPGTRYITCHKAVASNLKAVFEAIYNVRINGLYFCVNSLGCYFPRQMNSGSVQEKPKASIHSTGLAVDVNATENDLGKRLVGVHRTAGDDTVHMRTSNHPVVRIFQSAGWTWGGAWSNRDYMHFEYTSGNLPDGSWKADMVNWGSGAFVFGGSRPTLADCPINFNAILNWSLANCYKESHHLCATYVKKAFEAGGCVYVSGNGFNNQPWCERNGFVCIGDFTPYEGCPRPTATRGIQFPAGYVQQLGDVCLMTHSGGVGHMVYATGPGLDDWCSDFWQRPPGQRSGMGPYCYQTGVSRVQFWRHRSVLNGISGTYSMGFGYTARIMNALMLTEFPEFSPEKIEKAKIEPDDPISWINHDFNIIDPVQPCMTVTDNTDDTDYIEQRMARVAAQQRLGYDVDYDTNVLVTGPVDRKIE